MNISSSKMDYETSGAQEWQLPGYGRGPQRPRGSRSRSTHTRASASNAATRDEPQKQQSQGHTPQSSISRGASTAQARGMFRPLRARGSPGRQAAASHNSSHLFKDSPAKSKWRTGIQPTAVVKLPAAFGSFKQEFFGMARSTTFGRKPTVAQGRHEVFEAISRKTGAFVKPPSYTDQVIFLWGEPSQAASARDLLQKILDKCNSFSVSHKKKMEWAKINAYSVNKEAGVELKERRETMLQQFRKAPESLSAFPEQLLFLWPRDGPSLNESLGSQLEALDMIRARFGCHLFVPKDLPDYICAVGQNHEIMKQIANRLRTKWSETMANSNIKSKVYVVEPPVSSSMKEKIIVQNSTHFAKAFLHGEKTKDSELENWQSRIALILTKNNTRLLSAIEKALRVLRYVRGHLRMRINLGSFVLDEYCLPKDEKPAYPFEEFREMLLHEQTKGRLIPGLRTSQDELIAKCFKATHLLEPYDSTSDSLEDAEPAFSVNFEFLGSNNALLRLEAEFAKSPGAQEYEITQRRWLRPRKSGQSTDKRSPLQIGVIDFERSDWQIEVKSLEFYETSSIDIALKSFSHSIGFRRTANINDISAKPQRKVVFPASSPVSRFVEKTAIRYRLKGTKYIFELARYDEYSRANVPAFQGQTPASITSQISETPSTSWGASVFDPNWDNLLGGNANLSVGHTAQYIANLNTFFPAKTPTPEDKCTGFWEFIHLVKQVAELLGSAQTSSPESSQDTAKKILSNTTLDADLGTLF